MPPLFPPLGFATKEAEVFARTPARRTAHTQMDPGFEIVGLAALGAATSEFISWLLIYRKEEYQRLSASIANAVRLHPPRVLCRAPNGTTLWLSSRAARRRPLGTPHTCRAAEARALCPPAQSKRLEKEKEVPVKGGAKNKNLVRIEKELARENRDMAFHRMKSSVAAGILHALVFSYIYHKYDGQPVARLPFEPFTFIRQISHRNLPGNDYRECSVVFFYMLCSLCLRPLLQRAHGFAPSNNPSLMVRPRTRQTAMPPSLRTRPRPPAAAKPSRRPSPRPPRAEDARGNG